MAELTQKVSDVLLGQVGSSDAGYSFDESKVTTFATGMEIGAALKITGGKYVWAAIADVADVVGILIDVRTTAGYETLVNATDYTFVVAKRGTTINKNFLTLSDGGTAGNLTSAAEAFEAAGANKVTDKIAS
jgi:hypothetical protein